MAWAPEVFTEGDYHGTLSFPTVVQIFDSLFLMVEVLSVSVEPCPGVTFMFFDCNYVLL